MKPPLAHSLNVLRRKVMLALESARANPLHGLPLWVENEPTLRNRPVVCCGTGHWTGAFLHYAGDLNVIAVVDDFHAGKTIFNRPCLDSAGLLELALQRPDVVCVNGGQSDAGYSHFELLGMQRNLRMLSYLQAVRAFQLDPDIRVADWRNEIVANADEFLALESSLVDQLSVETLFAFLLYHLDAEREHLLQANRPGDATYFRSGLFELSSDETYVDCGTYDGDSVQRFIQSVKGRFHAAHAFEPDPLNFQRMEKWLAAQADFPYSGQISLHQKAVGAEVGSIRFNHTGGEGACVPITDEAGTTARLGTADGIDVQVVALDEYLRDRISLLKLDVEGHELAILRGATRHLLSSRPKLAVCAYHLPTDLVELPRYIQSLDAGYRFGLRHHSNSRYDTVLYAF